MPHFSGTANSYQDLINALVSACTANGWAQDGACLTKGPVAVHMVTNGESSTQFGTGILLRAGRGSSGGQLVDPAPGRSRLGPPSQSVSQPTWPMDYDIHLFSDPADEVYLVAQWGVGFYYWLAFGVSTVQLPNTGVWTAATSRQGQGRTTGNGDIVIGLTSGGNWNNNNASSAAPFFGNAANTPIGNVNACNCWLDYGLDGNEWARSPSQFSNETLGLMDANRPISPIFSRSLNPWNGQTVLLPIQSYVYRESGKTSLVLDLVNARLCRLHAHQGGEIITLGTDQWRVYPFYRRNADEGAGGSNIDHSGTLGWAIRYDGS